MIWKITVAERETKRVAGCIFLGWPGSGLWKLEGLARIFGIGNLQIEKTEQKNLRLSPQR